MSERLHKQWNRGVLFSALHVAAGLPERMAAVVALTVGLPAPILPQVVHIRNGKRLTRVLAGEQVRIVVDPV